MWSDVTPTELPKPPKVPCGSCPYRRDVPSGIWSRADYDKLPRFDGPTWGQDTHLFFCHQKDGCLCGGWLLAHDREHLLALRLHAVNPGVWTYDPGTPVFGSGAEARAHGLRDLERPSEAAQRKMDGLLRAGVARYADDLGS